VREADTLPPDLIDARLAEMIARAQAGKTRPADLEGTTFTITNLGSFAVDAFTPIVTLPQVAILGVGRIAPKAVPHEGQVAVRERLTLSLGFDHRAVDGAPAAEFLGAIIALVERPFGLLLSGANSRRPADG
jgi:pyruvate dehydrogenase E2 component (dihydrolipoamide acetyltransferase)